jgi:hypothetical protein
MWTLSYSSLLYLVTILSLHMHIGPSATASIQRPSLCIPKCTSTFPKQCKNMDTQPTPPISKEQHPQWPLIATNKKGKGAMPLMPVKPLHHLAHQIYVACPKFQHAHLNRLHTSTIYAYLASMTQTSRWTITHACQ